jgi:imidazolonepropionase-like amidohydrolase
MRALRLVTVDAARYLGIAAQAGTLRRGGTADLVLWSADPTEGAAAVEQVYIDGRPAFAAPRRRGQN